MATLYIDRRNLELAIDGDALICRDGDGRAATLPLGPIDRVYLRGGVRVNTSVLASLGAHDVAVIILHGRKGVPVLFHPRPHRDARLRCAQYRLLTDMTLRLKLSRMLVAGKIGAQTTLLGELAAAHARLATRLNERITILKSMARQVARKDSLDALRGLEGAAAHHYFAAFVELFPDSLHFSGRNRRPPRDPVNAALSLGYTLLHAEVIVAAYGHGLDPYIGFYHDLSWGRESLACDLVEPLRTEIDCLVIHLFSERILRPEHFTTSREGCYMGKAARQRFYREFERTAERMRRRLDELLGALAEALLETLPDGPDHDPNDRSLSTSA